MPDPTPQDFKTAMRDFVGACSLITTGAGAEASGLVVTSGISLTADPPMILACVNRSSSNWPLLRDFGYFGWSVLGAAHQGVAERFSGFGGIWGAAKYDGADWVDEENGARTLAGAPLAFACAVDEMIDRGTHSIVIGKVTSIRTTPGAGALIYWNGAYRSLQV